LTLNALAPAVQQPTSIDQVIGCDAGIHHVLTLSSMLFFSAALIRMLHRRYLHNRKTLQAKGTPASRKRLKAIGQREQRFNRDVNHCISKKLIALPHNLYVLEKLNGILETKSVSKSWETGKKHGNKRLHSWSFAQLQFFITYKAMAVGKRVESVYDVSRMLSMR
ncbi:IS200/IS605 family accessory protein TnpB-related protein, partial [bacterium]|nr:IS200/IS605 family accessory protein TnpB-related protein [bacterium]